MIKSQKSPSIHDYQKHPHRIPAELIFNHVIPFHSITISKRRQTVTISFCSEYKKNGTYNQ